MVHNGIEYGDMQLICEAYFLLRKSLGMEPAQLHDVFARWNKGSLDSFLIEITRDILGYVDPETRKPMVDVILDAAGQKGTGKWTVDAATELGIPLTLIAEAVFARCLSAQKDERVQAAKALKGSTLSGSQAPAASVDDIEQALYASKIVSYAQGFALMDAQARESKWEINRGGVALMWRGGCIIRSAFLGKIKEAFDRDPKLANLMLDPFFRQELERCQLGWRRTAIAAVGLGIPAPAITAALAYFDGYRCESLPANLLQAQRDFFGAHQYERVDRPRGQFFHTNWTGRGGTTASSSYNV
jgi:6-phosphogluconate dehydrogenase